MRDKLIRQLTITADGDDWGWSMSCWFGIAAELDYRGYAIPDHWQYRPSSVCGDIREDSYQADILKNFSSEELIYTGNILERYTRYLKFKGLDY